VIRGGERPGDAGGSPPDRPIRPESGLTPPSPEGQAAGPSPRTRLGAYAVTFDERGRVLLCRLSADEVEAGAWTLPGGGVEFGEHPDEAVLRELVEESGLTGRIEGILGIFSRVYERSRAADGGDLHFIGFLYRVAPTGGELRDEVDGSTDTCSWFAPGDLGELRLVGVARHALDLALPNHEQLREPVETLAAEGSSTPRLVPDGT
jgi:8-oxo-dGTP diphosphatase